MFKLKEYTPDGHAYFALSLSTPHEYYESGESRTNWNMLNIALFKHSWWFKVPEFLKPRKKWVDCSHYEWSKNPPHGYWSYTEKSYGVIFTEDSMHIYYGIKPGCWHSKDKKNSDHVKVFFYGWKQRTRECILFMRDDGIVHSVYQDDPDGRINFDRLRECEAEAPTYRFRFNDYDGEEIEATCRIEKSIYRRGTGFWKWLSWIYAPEIYKKLDINFNKETGYEKGSWKGGTLGTSIEMIVAESALDAFRRYGCEEDYYKNHGRKLRGFTNIVQL